MDQIQSLANELAEKIKDLSCDELQPWMETIFDHICPNVFTDYLVKNGMLGALANSISLEDYCECRHDPENLQKEFEDEYVDNYQVRERSDRALAAANARIQEIRRRNSHSK